MRWLYYGRTQLDPSKQNAGYHYAGDDPINQFDPSGLIDSNFNHLAQGFVEGCGLAAGTAFIYDAAVGSATGQFELTGGALATECLVGGTVGAVDAMFGNGIGEAYEVYDAYNTYRYLTNTLRY